ncbi:MAG: hypothetical protein WC807_20855 [Hyphomicrobium sp.]|jgi:hypothetical protein
MADDLRLFSVWLEEFASHEIVLPARTEHEARIIAIRLRQAFGIAAFTEIDEHVPDPTRSPRRPALDNPERLITDLARLYHLLAEKGPDRRAFADEFDILERQIEHLRAAGVGRFNTALRGHDTLVATRKLPRQVIPAGFVKRAPANPVGPASRLKKLQLAKVRDFARRIAHQVMHPNPPEAPPILPGEENMLRHEWRKLQLERAHVRDLSDPLPRHDKKTEQTAFDRLTRNARQTPPPAPAREQDHGPERD